MSRETLDVDVLIVGGGPAGLSAALRLAQLQKQHGGEPLSIAVLEKAREAGAHMLSGAVLDPSALRDLIPDFEAKGAPLAVPVHDDHVYFLTSHGDDRVSDHPAAAAQPRQLHHLAEPVRAAGWRSRSRPRASTSSPASPAQDVLMDGARVIGVRTGDRGIGRHGEQKPTFEPGVDIMAKVTIFCDGVRGNLTKELLRRLQLGAGRQPEQFALGLKELWEIPRRPPCGRAP